MISCRSRILESGFPVFSDSSAGVGIRPRRERPPRKKGRRFRGVLLKGHISDAPHFSSASSAAMRWQMQKTLMLWYSCSVEG